MGLPGGVPHQICQEEKEQKAVIPAAVTCFTPGMLRKECGVSHQLLHSSVLLACGGGSAAACAAGPCARKGSLCCGHSRPCGALWSGRATQARSPECLLSLRGGAPELQSRALRATAADLCGDLGSEEAGVAPTLRMNARAFFFSKVPGGWSQASYS